MREIGYYWIVLNDEIKGHDPVTVNGWEVAYYSEDGWYSIWDGGSYTDKEVTKINEKKLVP